MSACMSVHACACVRVRACASVCAYAHACVRACAFPHTQACTQSTPPTAQPPLRGKKGALLQLVWCLQFNSKCPLQFKLWHSSCTQLACQIASSLIRPPPRPQTCLPHSGHFLSNSAQLVAARVA
eukprot:scaffold86632_cov19-Tisochrysis_lutea.AAC.2